MPRYEVFGRRNSQETMLHFGAVDSPDRHLALLQARQGFARRGEADEIWIVEERAVHIYRAEAEGLNKSYREIRSYADLGRKRRLLEENISATALSEADTLSSSGPDLSVTDDSEAAR